MRFSVQVFTPKNFSSSSFKMIFLLTEKKEEEEEDEGKEKCFITIKSFVVLSPKNGNFPNRYLRRGSIQKISIITDFSCSSSSSSTQTTIRSVPLSVCTATRGTLSRALNHFPSRTGFGRPERRFCDSRHKEKLNFKKRTFVNI